MTKKQAQSQALDLQFDLVEAFDKYTNENPGFDICTRHVESNQMWCVTLEARPLTVTIAQFPYKLAKAKKGVK